MTNAEMIRSINTDTVVFNDIQKNQPGKNGSILRYAAKLIALGDAIYKDAPKGRIANEYEKTREFECLVRDELAITGFVSPEDRNGDVNTIISCCTSGDYSQEIKRAIDDEPKKAYLHFALGILMGDANNTKKAIANLYKPLYKAYFCVFQGRKVEVDEKKLNCIRYVAFYVLSTFLRRNRYKEALMDLHKKYLPEFKCFVSSEHIRLESISDSTLDEKDIRDAWNLCNKTMPEQCGVQMMYANMVSRLCEKDTSWSETKSGKEHLEQARIAIDRAIDAETHYSTVYAIRGKLLTWLGNYEEALKNVKKGIELQRHNHRNDSDYIERLVEFYDTQFTIEIKQKEIELQKKSNALEEELKNRDIKSLEILGLFTAVIGIMVGVLGGGAAGNAESILTLFGAAIITFTVFHFLINARQKTIGQLFFVLLISATVGLLMIVFASTFRQTISNISIFLHNVICK